MNPSENPFAPGAGNPPPELAGRDWLLERVSVGLRRGTSAHRQLNIYHRALAQGRPPQTALVKVVDWLRRETLRV